MVRGAADLIYDDIKTFLHTFRAVDDSASDDDLSCPLLALPVLRYALSHHDHLACQHLQCLSPRAQSA